MAGDFDRPQQRPPGAHPWTPEFLAVECKPLIAAVNGIALGIGLTSILWYDAIVASTEARFSMRFAAIGLTPEVSSSWMLPRVIGLHNAKEMMLTGRIYSAQDALELGLVRRLVEPDQLLPEAIALGQEIAANPASTLRTVKKMTFDDSSRPPSRRPSELARGVRRRAADSRAPRGGPRLLGAAHPRFTTPSTCARLVERCSRARCSSHRRCLQA